MMNLINRRTGHGTLSGCPFERLGRIVNAITKPFHGLVSGTPIASCWKGVWKWIQSTEECYVEEMIFYTSITKE